MQDSKLSYFLSPLKFSSLLEEISFYSILAIGQERIVFSKNPTRTQLKILAGIERFYEALGGIVGYHTTALGLILGHSACEARESYRAL